MNAQEGSMTTKMKKSTLVLAVLALAWSTAAHAQPIRGRVFVAPRGYVSSPFLYDPFWGPYYGYGAYPYAATAGRSGADIRVQATPKDAGVYVDGYYAGVASDFDGVFKRLQTSPGGHAITLHLEGYRTVTQNVYVRPGSAFKLHETLDTLAAGEASAPPPRPVRR